MDTLYTLVRSMIAGAARGCFTAVRSRYGSRIIIKNIPVISGAVEALSFLRPVNGTGQLSPLGWRLAAGGWRLAAMFVKSGVVVSVYRPRAIAA